MKVKIAKISFFKIWTQFLSHSHNLMNAKQPTLWHYASWNFQNSPIFHGLTRNIPVRFEFILRWAIGWIVNHVTLEENSWVGWQTYIQAWISFSSRAIYHISKMELRDLAFTSRNFPFCIKRVGSPRTCSILLFI